ncbi:MAG TPA: GH25 family lysozyme [Chloroflexota bacterium]|jgi:lysozyme
MTVQFIDVSNHQGVINWGQVKEAGKRGAFIKATEGIDFKDAFFPQNWAHAAQQELWRGAYHFARPGRGPSGADEAHFFCDSVLSFPVLPGDMYVIDLEEGPPDADLGAYLLDWCQTVESRTHVKPLIYSAVNMLMHWKAFNRDDLAAYGLWLAAPGTTTIPAPPAKWSVTAFHQFDWFGRVPGVDGNCDLDVFNGDEKALAKYGVPGA